MRVWILLPEAVVRDLLEVLEMVVMEAVVELLPEVELVALLAIHPVVVVVAAVIQQSREALLI